jgi:hypothetical protein
VVGGRSQKSHNFIWLFLSNLAFWAGWYSGGSVGDWICGEANASREVDRTMPETNAIIRLEKLAKIWSSRREQEIAVQVQYEVVEDNGCRIYRINMIQEVQ